ncbi:zinc dependent phospholipase C family protein [Sphaerisporangium sp. NBC_01403]|uniref:tectonin domain-containing protein n=1 Tax=Sphaerisporangium sp. NBC_01403 TaxID=2903599 RepID=UPI00325235E1
MGSDERRFLSEPGAGDRDGVVPTLRSISVAGDGSVWGLDPAGALVQNTEHAETWQPRPGSPARVSAAADGSVFGVDEKGALLVYSGIWQWLGPIPGATLATLAAVDAATVWGVDTSGAVHRYDAGAATWTAVPGPAKAPVEELHATSDGSVFALDASGVLSRLDSSGWSPLTPPPERLRSFGAGASGWLWGIGSSGAVMQYDGGDAWENVPAPGEDPVTSIACGDDITVWVLGDSGTVYEFEPKGTRWTALPAPSAKGVARMSVGSRGSAWVVCRDDGVQQYVRHLSLWSTAGLDLPLARLAAVDRTSLWGLDDAGGVHRAERSADGWGHTVVPGRLSWISAAGNGIVWGVDAAGTAYRFVDAPDYWAPVALPEGKATRVSVTADGVVMVLCGGSVLRYEPDDGDWTKVGTPPEGTYFTDLSAMPEGAAYAVDKEGGLHLYLGTWFPAGGPAIQVSAGGGDVWVLDSEGRPVRRAASGESMEATHGRPAKGVAFWDAESVFDEARSTHLWIVNRGAALAGQEPEVGARLLALVQPFKGRLGNAFHDNLCQGLNDADFLPQYNNPMYGQATYMSHFYDPANDRNWFGFNFPTALTEGTMYFEQAVAEYQAERLGEAGYALGLALHYLTDLTQPMHSGNFIAGMSWPNPFYHTDFESYAMEIQSTVKTPAKYQACGLGTSPGPYLVVAAKASKLYYRKVVQDPVTRQYVWFTPAYQKMADIVVPSLLSDAVTIVSQFLVAWMRRALDTGPGWHWADLGTPLTSTVARGIGAVAVRENARSEGHPYVFVQGADGHLWLNWQDDRGWHWRHQGGDLSFGVGVTAIHDTPQADRPYVFVRGKDENLWINWWTGKEWVWTRQDGTPTGCTVTAGLGAVALARTPSAGAQPFAVVRCDDRNVWVNWWNSASSVWRWTNLGHPPNVDVAQAMGVLAVSDGQNPNELLHVYVLGTDGRLWGCVSDLETWQWTDLGAVPGHAITGAAGALTVQDWAGQPNRPYVFVVADDGHLWANWSNGTVRQWRDHGSADGRPVRLGLGAVTVQDKPGGLQNPIVLVTDGEGSVWANRWTGGTWVWEQHGGLSAQATAGLGFITTKESPTAPQQPRVFMGSADGHVYANWYR